jgi:predicted phosphoribosyltransferase
VICLQTPADFQAVGQFYLEFSQVSDAEVVEVLRESAAGHG